MKHLQNMLDGMASVLGSMASSRPYVTELGGFKKDSVTLAKDVRTLSTDLQKQSDAVYGTFSTGAGHKRR